MTRRCPTCDRELPAHAARCGACGTEMPEARDRRSDPDDPHCALCGTAIPLMTERCPSCGADGYPALRSRRGKKSLGSRDGL
jgi:predicted amidophosphoribosyltransferase